MAKPPTRQVPSDDCAIEVDGVEYHPHEGEWVRVVSRFSVDDLRLMRRFSEFQSQMDAIEGDEALKQVILMDDSFSDVLEVLQHRLMEWNWTDDSGEPLSQPHENPTVLRSLRIEELMYLVLVVRGESPGEASNGSAPSPTTSSATPRQRRRTSSSGGRSR